MGAFLIIAGIAVCFLWAVDIQKGKENFEYRRLIHDEPLGGCIPYIIGIGLIILGVILIF